MRQVCMMILVFQTACGRHNEVYSVTHFSVCNERNFRERQVCNFPWMVMRKLELWCQTTGNAKGLQLATDAMLSESERERRLERKDSRARSVPDGTCAETRCRLAPKRTSPFKSVGESVQSTAGSRGVRISISNAGNTTFRDRVRVLVTHSSRQFPLHFPSRALPCATTFRTQYNTGRNTRR